MQDQEETQIPLELCQSFSSGGTMRKREGSNMGKKKMGVKVGEFKKNNYKIPKNEET